MNPQVFGAGIHGKSPAVTAMRRLNCYYDIQKDADRTSVAIHGRPGLTQFDTMGETRIRGMHALGDALYVAHRDTLYKVIPDGTHSVLGSLDTDFGQVYFSNNGIQIMLVDGISGYIFNTSSEVFAKITDGDFPANPISVTFMNGYFIVCLADSQAFFISALVDGTSWDALDFDSAYVDPDNLKAVYAYQGVLALFGERSTEYWGFTGAADFPFGRVVGANYGWGLAAPASIATFGSEVICLARNILGEAIVTIVTAAEPLRVSTSDLEFEINGFTAQDDAVGFSFMLNGHLMYQLSFPSAGKTWVYDRDSNIWSEFKSAGAGQHRGLTGVWFNNAVHMGDFENGIIYIMDQDVHTDNGSPIEMELISEHIHSDNDYFRLNEFQLDMEEGVGIQTGQGSDPQVMLAISRDKGRTFGNELWTDIGKAGKYKTRVKWRKLGRARDAVFKIRITDPIKRVITGELLVAEGGT